MILMKILLLMKYYYSISNINIINIINILLLLLMCDIINVY